jgi:hypothetical protein
LLNWHIPFLISQQCGLVVSWAYWWCLLISIYFELNMTNGVISYWAWLGLFIIHKDLQFDLNCTNLKMSFERRNVLRPWTLKLFSMPNFF